MVNILKDVIADILAYDQALRVASALVVDSDPLTCEHCDRRASCPFVDDPYNTGGDCLANK